MWHPPAPLLPPALNPLPHPTPQTGILSVHPFETLDVSGVGELVRIAVERGRKARPGIELGICGEHGGDPQSVAFFEEVRRVSRCAELSRARPRAACRAELLCRAAGAWGCAGRPTALHACPCGCSGRRGPAAGGSAGVTNPHHTSSRCNPPPTIPTHPLPYPPTPSQQVGLDYVSCSPLRVPIARLAAAQAVLRAKKA